MSPSVGSGVTSFSQCSLDAMQVAIDSASCLAETAPDLALAPNLGSEAAATGGDSTWVIRISNQGAGAAVGGRVTVQLAAQLSLVSASTASGSCSAQGALVTCNLPTIAAQAAETLTLTVRSATAGTFSIEAEVAVADDANAANDSGAGTLTVSAGGATPPPPAPEQSRGGGGGALDLWTLLALLSTWAMRSLGRNGGVEWRRRQRAPVSRARAL
jgi:hypothetical protein